MEGIEEAVQKEEQVPQAAPEDVQMQQPIEEPEKIEEKPWVFGGWSTGNQQQSFANDIQNTDGKKVASIFKDFC